MSHKILLFGANGQIGWRLRKSLSPLGEIVPLTRQEVDLTDKLALHDAIKNNKPTIIVNAAAYTAVDRAEEEELLAEQINADAPAIMAEEAAKSSSFLVHYSTDYVFDGTSTEPYEENDQPGALSAYGRTKLKGEELIVASGCRHLIFRTSWVYDLRGRNFIKTILRLARDKEKLEVVGDQFGSPTSASFIADVTAQCLGHIMSSGVFSEAFSVGSYLEKNPQRDLQKNMHNIMHIVSGIYHLTSDGIASWCEIAKHVVQQMSSKGLQLSLKPENIIDVATDKSKYAARRPLYSKMNTNKINSSFGIHIPKWQYHVDILLEELLERELRIRKS